MLEVRRSRDRGYSDNGWLKTFHSFAFADYFDPEHVEFGPLRVVNEARAGKIMADVVDSAQAANDSAQASLLGARAGLQAAIDQKAGAQTKIAEAQGQLGFAERFGRGKKQRLQQAQPLVHSRPAAAPAPLRRKSGPKARSWRNSTRPAFASSSVAA